MRDRLGQGHARLSPQVQPRDSRRRAGWSGGNKGEHDLLASCYRTALSLAAQHRLASIAFPAISTGVYRFPPERAARIAVGTVASEIGAARVVSSASSSAAFPPIQPSITSALDELGLGEQRAARMSDEMQGTRPISLAVRLRRWRGGQARLRQCGAANEARLPAGHQQSGNFSQQLLIRRMLLDAARNSGPSSNVPRPEATPPVM